MKLFLSLGLASRFVIALAVLIGFKAVNPNDEHITSGIKWLIITGILTLVLVIILISFGLTSIIFPSIAYYHRYIW